jgi:hypothetical protein
MIIYKLNITNEGAIQTVNQFVDGKQTLSIPFDPANTDYQAYLKWVSEGGVPLPADE